LHDQQSGEEGEAEQSKRITENNLSKLTSFQKYQVSDKLKQLSSKRPYY